MSEIEVKALEWGPHPQFGGDDLAVARVPQWGEQGHKYQVGRDADAPGYKAFLAPLYGSWFWTSDGHASLEDAKRAAQSDYEARIRSALVERKAEPVEWQRHVEGFGWQRVNDEDLEHYREKGVTLRPLYSTPPAAPVRETPAPALDWSNFEGPKRNVEWKPDDQDLIYTAINYRDDEYGDADEDVGQQLVERLLAAWRSSVISEQLTFEISARLLKERDEAHAALSASPSPVDSRDALIERLVTPHSYAQEYEFRGDGGDYVPTDAERTMIEDAICGYLGELAEAHLALSAAKEQQP